MSKYMDALDKIEERKAPRRSVSHSELIEFVNARPFEKKRYLPLNSIALSISGVLLIIAFYWAAVYQKSTESSLNHQSEINSTLKSESSAASISLKYFTIQLAAYRDALRADKELEKLTTMGLGNTPFIYEERGEFKVCLGQFSANATAYRELLDLRAARGPKFYKDAFVRIIKK